jgi:hypothetical protein
MKKLISFTIAIFLMVSCTVTERMVISETGMVEYETEINLTEMISFMYPENVRDSLSKIGQFPLDTTFTYLQADQFFKTNSAETTEAEKEFFQTLDKSSVKFTVNEKEGFIKMITQKMNIKDFNDYWQKIDAKILELEKKYPDEAAKTTEGSRLASLNIHYDGKTFRRITNSDIKILNGDNSSLLGGEMANMMTYKLEYHFPKPIKKTSLEYASFSLDRKTMWVEIPIDNVLSQSDAYNFTVEFE